MPVTVEVESTLGTLQVRLGFLRDNLSTTAHTAAIELVDFAELAAKRNLKASGAVFRGTLMNSLDTEIVTRGSSAEPEVRAALFTNEPHGGPMDLGRSPGKMPPPSALEPWVKRKLGVTKAQVKSVAFLVARKIGRKGIAGRRYMQDALIQTQERALVIIKRVVADLLKESRSKQ